MAGLTPILTENEIVLMSSFYASAHSYVEFGCGGSTVLAAGLVGGQIIMVDSDQAWLAKVTAACSATNAKLRPQACFVDLGPIRELGYPADDSRRGDWPLYYEQVWSMPGASEADLYMIDGRFRVACFLQILLRASPYAVIAIHDYATRPQYHPVGQFARELCRVDDLAIFQPRAGYVREAAAALMLQHRFDPR